MKVNDELIYLDNNSTTPVDDRVIEAMIPFFKNNMSVMFSINGQVHGNYSSEFITRTLKFNLLKDYILIHFDCTSMNRDFREELFMASRDRLKHGEKIIKFDSDIDSDYFDRTDEPGELQLSFLKIKRDRKDRGDQAGISTEASGLHNVTKSSPNTGTIRITLEPTNNIQIGDEIEIKVSLTSPEKVFKEIVLVKIADKESTKEPVPEPKEDLDQIGLPKLQKIYEKDWAALEERGITMDCKTVMYPSSEGDKLEEIFINLDSHVFLSHRSKLKNEDQIVTAQRKYISSVYFHTLFLYMITKRRNYNMTRVKDGIDVDITIDEYIMDVFDSYYSNLLLNFGMEQLMGALEE